MKVIFTGGGTAGHAMVNTVLIPRLQKKDCNVSYIGSVSGMEKDMIDGLNNVAYYGIAAGKLRRYLSLKNFLDIFRIFKGLFEAYRILKKESPQLVYSSGGYVSVPVVWAARLRKIPVILRETDCTIGLANKLCIPFAQKIYATFPDSTKKLKNACCPNDGMIIRPQLYDTGFLPVNFINSKKPVCLVMGGSSGAAGINELIWNNINILTQKYSIIHLCGKGKYNAELPNTDSYRQLEFVNDMGLFYHLADVIISRSGSNAIIENLLLGKRMVCIPLSVSASRGEQLLNAEFAQRNGTAVIISDDKCNVSVLLKAIREVLAKDTNDIYKISKKNLTVRIKSHVDSIYDTAFEQLKKDMKQSFKSGKKINFNDLNAFELSVFDELSADFEV